MNKKRQIQPQETDILFSQLLKLQLHWQQGHVVSAECAILYFMTFLLQREGSSAFQWMNKKSFFDYQEHGDDKLEGDNVFSSDVFYSLFDLSQWWPQYFSCFNEEYWKRKPLFVLFQVIRWKHVPLAAVETLEHWSKGQWPCLLFHRVLKPKEVLRLQAEGQRCVTIFFQKDEINSVILDGKDALEFFIHDLVHAQRFFSRQKHYHGQIGFYRLMEQSYGEIFRPLAVRDPFFQEQLDYLISDMNTYCGHQFFYLKAILIEFFLRFFGKMKHESLSQGEKSCFEDFFATLLKTWKVPQDVQQAMKKANTADFLPTSDLSLIEHFFYKNGCEKMMTL